jgi:micrococcal nuclease|tara:strand:- start:296 stop:694 length:399 start_codon:yes stop_codon:yes gene_type:complete
MYEYRCKVSRVVDGDTVDVDIDLGFGVWLHKERVRIIGIDTPESRTRDKVEKRFGLLAKEFVEDFFKIGDVILTTKKYDAKGKFGRILGDFKCNGRTLSKVMIEMHHAVEYHGQSKEDIREAHLANRRKVKI